MLIAHVELLKWAISGLITHLLGAKRGIGTGALGVKRLSIVL